jgi:hypothetical protein
VFRAGQSLSKSDDVYGGDILDFTLPETKLSELKPVDLPLSVIYIDPGNLPEYKGLPVNPKELIASY